MAEDLPVKQEGSLARQAHVDASAERILASAAQPARTCYICLSVDCEEHPGESLLSTGCACCRESSSGGRVHVSCLAGAAAHQEDLWEECPTCKQLFTGPVRMGMARAHWELCQNRPEADDERLMALGQLVGALMSAGDDAVARPLLEELVAVERGRWGPRHAATLFDIGRLGALLARLGEHTEARPLLEEALVGLRTVGGEDGMMLTSMTTLGNVHEKLGDRAMARLLLEEAAAASRRAHRVTPETLAAIENLGRVIANSGDRVAALTLQEEAVAFARRELGPAHPATPLFVSALEQSRQIAAQVPGTRALGTLVGLASKPELNDKLAFVVGFDVGKRRYRVRPGGTLLTTKPIGIKPTSLILNEGSAVIMEGLDTAPEWNGARGLVESYDATQGRYRLLVKGRKKALGVKVACVKLEFAVEQEQREHKATRRATVEANVAAALALRKQQDLELDPEPEHPEPEPELRPV